MPDQNQHNDITELVSRYLSGNASKEEIRTLEQWVAAAPENKALFVSLKKAWMLSGASRKKNQTDVSFWWQQTAGQLFEHQIVPFARRRMFISLAAAILALLVAVFWLFGLRQENQPAMVQSEGEVRPVLLKDGSHITLNQASSLTYELEKATNKRVAKLTGDAFFEIARDETKPFVVVADSLEIEVLGTSFYVDARESQSAIQVVVTSGKVAVRKGNQEVELMAGQKAVLDKSSGQLLEIPNQDTNFLSFKTGDLIFQEDTFETLAFALERHFHTKIRLEIKDLHNCEITARYENKSLESIIHLIESTFSGIAIEKEGAFLVFRGDSCQ